MERKIGEIFEFGGEWYQCVKSMIYCPDCAFFKRDCRHLGLGKCDAIRRSDNENVVFKKLEKVGEPYEFEGYLFQSYRTFEVPIFTENYATVRESGNNSKISIEIKQKQEDMEEKKNNLIEELDNLFRKHNIYISDSVCESMACEIGTWFAPQNNEELSQSESIGENLRPFDLEAAKSGKPVCTRGGRKARIICFDFKNDDYPLVAAVEEHEGKELTLMYTNKGFFYQSEKKDNLDLMMLPEKKEGWLNIVKGTDGSYCCKGEVHSDYNDAILENINVLDKRGITVKIEWDE